MSEHPHWYTAKQPNTNWNEADAARFDSPPFAAHYKMGVDHPNYTPPLDPQQEPHYVCYVCGKETNDAHTNHEGEDVCANCCDVCKNEQIADAARLAADDIEAVLRVWPYAPTYPLHNLRALLARMQPTE